MDSLEQVIEKLILLAAGGNNTIIDGTITNTASEPSGPFDLITSFLSSKAFRDWAIILVIGSLYETGRRLLSSWWSSLVNSFFLTVTFDEDDISYQWIQLWLSKHPSWQTARNVSITTSNFGLAGATRMRDARMANQKKIAYLPAVSKACSLWHKSSWMQVTRQIELSRGGWSFSETLTLRILARDRNILTEMIRELQIKYQKARRDSIAVYTSRVRDDSWRKIAAPQKRPLNSIILDPGVVDLVIGDARDFLRSKQWYADRGIPFRRGYLLYGTPGAGKTSLIHSIAGELGLDIYIVSLSRSGLDDTRLIELISNLPKRCIALMEDIDAAFHHGVNRESPEGTAKPTGPHDSDDAQRRNGRPVPTRGRISLSGLLNALDGIAAQEGRILFATTNKYNALDRALRRPGRLDLHVEFRHASRYQAEELFKCFYTLALPELPREAKTNEVEVVKSESESGDLGFEDAPIRDLIDLSSSCSSSVPPSTSESSASVISETTDAEPHAPPRRAPTFTGISHRVRPPQLSSDDITKLAGQFADSVPQRQISMASLQGFLMMYKTRPYEAVASVSAWVEQELGREEGVKQKTTDA